MDKVGSLPLSDTWGLKRGFVLASGSPARLKLLQNAGFIPTRIQPAEIDERVLPNELPGIYVRRMAREKALAAAKLAPNEVILSADTVIAVGRRIIRKATDETEARRHLDLISGHAHRVMTAFCVLSPQGQPKVRLVTTRVVIKHLSEQEKNILIRTGEWRNVAGYSIEGYLSAVVKKIVGSYPNVVGLPIYDVAKELVHVLS